MEMCKIQQTGKYFFMASGIKDDQKTGFDLFTIARDVLSQRTGSLKERIARFDVMLEPQLRKSVAHIRSEYPAEFRAHLRDKALNNIFATWEDGRPLLIRDGWKITKSGTVLHAITARAGAGINDNFIMDASQQGAKGYWESHPELGTMHPVSLFPLLIQIEINRARIDSSVLAGPPVTVLSVNQSGAVWSKQGRCPDIAPY